MSKADAAADRLVTLTEMLDEHECEDCADTARQILAILRPETGETPDE